MNGLINSDGWIWSGPIINHLVDPLTVLPKKLVDAIRTIPIKRHGPESLSQFFRLIFIAR